MSSEIRVKDKESLDSALRRFKKSCARSGIIQEVRKREAYEKPSVRRKKKSEVKSQRIWLIYFQIYINSKYNIFLNLHHTPIFLDKEYFLRN